MQANDATQPDDAHFIEMHDNTKAPPPPMLPRAASERARPAFAPRRQSASVRALIRMTSTLQEEIAGQRATGPTMMRRSMTAPMFAPLVRAVSTVLRLKSIEEENFRCFICYDDAPVSGAVTLATCGHQYCQACFKTYLELKITEGNVYPVCFHPIEDTGDFATDAPTRTCGVAVAADQIKSLVDAESWAKYEYFRFNKEHEHARECPYCAHSQDCAGPENPVCVCIKCEKSFCFFHGNAHEDDTCADYELKTAHDESLNRAKIDEISKPCPGCHRDVEKNGGCNHMKCIGCETNFCWLCGEIIEDSPTPSHYATTSKNSCSGRQFDAMEEEPLSCAVRTYIFVLTLIVVPIATILAIPVAPFVWCCKRHESFLTVFTDVQVYFTVLLATGFSFIYTTIVWIVELILAPFIILGIIIYEGCRACCCPAPDADDEFDDDNDMFQPDLEAAESDDDLAKTETAPANLGTSDEARR